MSQLLKSADAFKNITEAAEEVQVDTHVLRYWEVKFPQISPLKLGGRRRFYSPENIELLNAIKVLLHKEGYTTKGVQKLLDERGIEYVVQLTQGVPKDFSIELPDNTPELENILTELEYIEDKLKMAL